MEPIAPSLTEEDLTEVKKDVSSTALPRRPEGWGRAGAGCSPAGEESGNPESEWEEEPVGRGGNRSAVGPAFEGPWWKLSLGDMSVQVLNRQKQGLGF